MLFNSYMGYTLEQKDTNKTQRSHRHRQQYGGYQQERQGWEAEESKEDHMYGDGSKLDSGW